MITVVLDRHHARFFDVTEQSAEELSCLSSHTHRGGKFHSDRGSAPGGGERAYHQRRIEEERRHFAAVSRHLASLVRERPEERLLVAGPGTLASQFRRALPPALARRVAGTAKLSPTDAAEVTPKHVRELAREALQRDTSARAAAAITAVEEGLGRNRATNGAADTLRALADGRVRTLLVPGDVHGRSLGAATASARRQHADVLVVRDPKLASGIDGLAALLRF